MTTMIANVDNTHRDLYMSMTWITHFWITTVASFEEFYLYLFISAFVFLKFVCVQNFTRTVKEYY